MENLEEIRKEVENTTTSFRTIGTKYKTNHTKIRTLIKKYNWNVEHRKPKQKEIIPFNNPHETILGKIATRKIEEIKKELKKQKEIIREFPKKDCGEEIMAIYVDIYGNEFREVFKDK